ncbi:glycosyl transferase [Acinetobacter sp. NCu2D-2]|uniref:glycosyltransferase n=1 Tax=Acinetobacter sp. NCu2D-2 TaxID=1608473 RepID=UPI0007CDE9E2|nr:glycosyltransferase [Acinetobacter sp. NCu2D-2]ANF82876.1 glycosyl transferase [Acinetobacter sp. NCu2D-2]
MSVIASIVLYKHLYEELSPTLDSLLNSDEISKIVLVDNDQSDWANKLSNPKIIYLKSEGNYGFGYGHNIAIKKFSHDCQYFLICNPDISFEKSEFTRLIEFAKTQPHIGLFLPRIMKLDGSNQYGARLLPTPMNLFARRFSPKIASYLDDNYLLRKYKIDKPIFAPSLLGCFMLFDSNKLMTLGGFDERFFMYMEDIDLSRRCAEKFGNIYYPFAFVTHLHEQGSYKNPVLLKAHIKSAWQYFNKWGWLIDTKRTHINKNCIKQFE